MIIPDFNYEHKLWKTGFKFIGGCDEVGRGSFAGPVVCACVSFHPDTIFTLQGENLKGIKINDSKKLTAPQRKTASEWIRNNCLAWGVGVGTVAEINKLGMSKATNSAFRRAIKMVKSKFNIRVNYLLIDAFYIPYVRGLKVGIKNGIKERKDPNNPKGNSRQMPIINGDEKSISIAAASIIAKVYRDKLMVKLAKKHKNYGWEKNKGYGTSQHRNSIKKHGLSKYHRKQFVETFLNNSSSSQVL
jgi:ribonuclease HII